MAINILSTKILSPAQKAILTDAQLIVQEYDAIRIELFDREIDSSYKNIIFTSQNTVKAFLKNMEKRTSDSETGTFIPVSEIKAYCVGEKTRAFLEHNGIPVLESTHYGAELAKILVDKYQNESFLFLCGDKRLAEIPSQFQRHGIRFREQVVYSNSPNIQHCNPNFDGILFFSPTGIESYMVKNRLEDRLSFCIGTTTAAEAKKYTDNIVVANKPTVESVLEKVVAYFK